MNGYCKMPTSALHKRLIKESGNSSWANEVYVFTKTNAFKKLFGDKMIYDSNGEPTYESLISLFNTEAIFSPEKYISRLESTLNDNLPDYNYEIIQRAVDFNKNNEQYYAEVIDLNKSKSQIVVRPRTADDQVKIDNLENNLKTFKTIDSFLKQLGIQISILDPTYLKNEDGLLIPSNLNPLVKGTMGVVNIANNVAGFKVLTEEFSHFIVECCKNNPIIQRCETFLSEHMDLCQAILQDEFDTVRDYYRAKGRPELLFREVMGRILAQQINDSIFQDSSILQRGSNELEKFIERTFKLNKPELVDAFNQIQTELTSIGYNFIHNKNEQSTLLREFKQNGDRLAHTSDLINDDVGVIEKNLVANVQKYIDIYKKHNVKLAAQLESLFGSANKRKNLKEGWMRELRNLLQNEQLTDEDLRMLCDEYATLKYLQSVFNSSTDFLKDLYTQFQQLFVDLDDNFDLKNLTQNASVIRGLKNFILVYRENLQELRTALDVSSKRQLQTDIGLQQARDLTEKLDELDIVISKMDTQLYNVSKKLVYNFCLPFFNDTLENTITIAGTSISKEVVIKLSHVLNYIDGDINPVKMWVDTAYNSPDIFTQVLSTAIKAQQDKIYRNCQTEILELNKLASDYDLQHTDYLFEKNSENGEWTGYYVNKYGIDFFKYNQERNKDIEAIKNNGELNAQQKAIAIGDWYRENTYTVYVDNYIENPLTGLWEKDPNESHKIGITIPHRNSRWNSDAYSRLNASQQQVCDRILEIKHKLDSVNGLSGSNRYFKCVQKTINSASEAMFSTNGGIWKQMLRNKLKITQEDTEFGHIEENSTTQTAQQEQSFWRQLRKKFRDILYDNEQSITVKRTLTDFEHKIYHKVPLNYVADLDEINRKLLSTNVADTLLHYTVASYQHAGMSEIADIMELALDIAKHRKLLKYDENGRQLIAQSDDDDVMMPVFEDSSGARVNQQLEYFIRSQIYSEYKDKGETILNGEVSISKLSDGILRLTSLGLLGYNPFTAVNNVLVGRSQMFAEGFFGKDTFTLEALRKARHEYYRLLAEGGFGELNAISKDSKLYLLTQVFDPEKDWIKEEINKGVYKPDVLRLLEKFGPSFMMAAGEHYLKYVGLLAMLYSVPMLDAHGDKTNLYDSLEIVEKTINGNKIKTLQIKRGYTKPNGSEWTFVSKRGLSDLQRFKNKMTIVNHKMHGIYDYEDYIMLKKIAVGRIIMLFRNFMVPYIQKRWKGSIRHNVSTYNLQLGSTDDGVYVTFLKFLKQCIFPNTDLITENGEFSSRITALIEGLSDAERANLHRFLGEILLTFTTSMLLFFAFRDWDDDKDVWSLRACNYFLRRLHTELTYAYSLSSLLDILQSPTAVMGPLNDILRIIKSIGDDHILQSGPYKGQTRFKANVQRAMPIYGNLKDFFELGASDKRFKIFEDSFFYKNSDEKQEVKVAA